MEEWLKEITAIQGVEGALVASNSGKILGKWGLSDEDRTLVQIARHAWRLTTSYTLNEKTVKEIEFVLGNYRVIAMPRREFMVLAFCNSGKAVSLIRMTVNVVVTHLLEDKKFIKLMDKESVYKTAVLKGDNMDSREINLISKLQ